MNKRKLGALLSLVGVATAIAATQFIDLDQTNASYLSLDFVHQALQIKGDYLTADQTEDDFQSQSSVDQSKVEHPEVSPEALPEKMTSREFSIDAQDIDLALPEAEAASMAAAEEKQKAEEEEKNLKENVKEKESSFKGKVIVEELNAREEANTEAEILGKLKKGDLVEGEKKDEWIQIQLDEKTAFVAAEFVEPLEEKDKEEKPAPAPEEKAEENPVLQQEPVIQENPVIDQAVLEQARIAQEEEENRLKAIEQEAIEKAQKEAAEEAAKKAAAEKKAEEERAAKKAAEKKAKEVAEAKAREEAAKKASQQQEASLMADQTYENNPVGKAVSGTVCYDGVNVRALPTLNSDIVATLAINTPVQGKVVSGGWVQFNYNGKKVYISGKMVQVGGPNTPTQLNQPVSQQNQNNQNQNSLNPLNGNAENGNGTEVKPNLPSLNSGRLEGQFPQSAQGLVQAARAQLGKPYVLGTTGPSTFDCSGLTMTLYRLVFGMSIPRSVDGQAAAGTPVSRGNLQVGDLVFFDPNHNVNAQPAAAYGGGQENGGTSAQQTYTPRLGHVGIYIGGGRIIHASTPQTGVIESGLSETWYANHYVCARRILH